MAVTISGAASEAFLRLQWRDFDGEPVVQTIALASDVTDADVIAIVTAMDALSNAKIEKATLSVGRGLIGMKANAVDAVRLSAFERMILTFKKVNPVNSSKLSLRSVGVPAYIQAVKSGAHPLDTQTNLATLYPLLQTNLDMIGADGAHYPGSFTYDNDLSGFITVTSKTDGLPG